MEIKDYGDLYCYFKLIIKKNIINRLPFLGIFIFISISYSLKIIRLEVSILDFIIFGILFFLIFNSYYVFCKQAHYSFKYLKDNEELLEKELENFILDKESLFLLTENYYIDLATLNIVKFDDIVTKKYRFAISIVPSMNGINRYCKLKDNKGRSFTIILYSLARKYDEGSKVYDIIEERLSDLNK